MSDENFGWKQYVPSLEWHRMCINAVRAGQGFPFEHYVHVEWVRGSDTTSSESRVAATWADDHCRGRFYWRDWMDDGLPCVQEGGTYWSGFWFEDAEDARDFQHLYRGSGSWEPDHKEFVDRCRAKAASRWA